MEAHACICGPHVEHSCGQRCSIIRSCEFVRLPLLIVTLGGAGLIRVTQLIVLLLVSGVEGRLLGQGVFVGDCQHLLICSRILHGELADQGWVPESFLEEHDD
jgi:hypothetical protein